MTPLIKDRSVFMRLFYTLRHLKAVQFYGRLWFRLYRPRFISPSEVSKNPVKNNWIKPCEKVVPLLSPGMFRFLNKTRICVLPGDWNNNDWEKLWIYNLHYFDVLQSKGAECCIREHEDLILEWVKGNPPGFGNGWEPYPISLRMVNWVKWALSGNVLSDVMLKSMWGQADYLFKRLEFHLLGNHLLANAKALVFAGLFFVGHKPGLWLKKGLKILERELPEQVLADGGHMERSPMYHSIILEDLLDLINVMRTYSWAVPKEWTEKAEKMISWLSGMTHPDGEIALFNDAAFGIAAKPEELEAYAKRLALKKNHNPCPGLKLFSDTGYVRLEKGPAVAFIDAGQVGPDYQPGHAHADTLSFELSLFGERLVVDTGTSSYGDPDERDWQRGTAAHNTVTVNSENSTEVWGGFRVARRAKPANLVIEKLPGELKVACSHTGYRRLPGKPVHRRKWALAADSLMIKDTIHGQFKQARGRIYLHPKVTIDSEKSSNYLSLVLPGGRKVNVSVTGGIFRVVNSTWHPEFGLSVQNICIEISFMRNSLQTKLTW